MISVALALRLRDAGLPWEPSPGDRFVVTQPDLLDRPFVLSDMTVEVHHFPSGKVIGFNGTTEWALDSVDLREALWLPGEDQLRDLLGEGFRRLERTPAGYRVVVAVDGEERAVEEGEPADCYAAALLSRLEAGHGDGAAGCFGS